MIHKTGNLDKINSSDTDINHILGFKWINHNLFDEAHVDGYRDISPLDTRPKLPFSEYHVQKTFMHALNIRNYTDAMRSVALLTAYCLLLRPGAIGFQKRSQEKNLLNKSINWHPSFENAKEISIKVEASKTNRWGHKTEIIYASCNCKKIKSSNSISGTLS